MESNKSLRLHLRDGIVHCLKGPLEKLAVGDTKIQTHTRLVSLHEKRTIASQTYLRASVMLIVFELNTGLGKLEI